MIVSSRLYFLKSMNPTIQQCVRGSCVEIESLQHCFFSCAGLTKMWRSLWQPWRKAFAVDLEWRILLFPKLRVLDVGWSPQHKVLLLLWRIHTAIVFHATWRLRNDILFKETTADQPSVENVTASFRRHCQFIFHHPRELHTDDKAIASVVERLGFAPLVPRTMPSESHIWIPQP
ncbi:Pol Polyprotein [Phytophthora megakarya]|uniref:Pol Polyprotein n=1 Tax=Phytophthora megakarya TaxID=4795 RepID=A0A225UR65_9STRA|nr:Pol Polyprotein [Phytophthora megakarya]